MGYTYTINDADDMTQFMTRVNSGSSFSGTTVLLASDIDLSGSYSSQFNPIGISENYYFRGIFDGQGYAIKGLTLGSTYIYAGLFGYSKGTTIRNLVMDVSCTVSDYYSGTNNVHVGGVIGFCYTDYNPCAVENVVSMTGVSVSQSIGNYYYYLGGIAGYMSTSSSSSSGYEVTIKNCANYGPVSHSGTSKNSYLGGIVGYIDGCYSNSYVLNCFNSGTITHSRTTSSNLFMGGIAGLYQYGILDNCVSAGDVTSNQIQQSSNYIGSFLGSGSSSQISHSYWTSAVDKYRMCGTGTALASETSFTVIDTEAAEELSKHSTYKGWSRWLLNTNESTLSFSYNARKSFLTLSSRLVLLPDLAKNGAYSFCGWFSDAAHSKPLASTVTSDATLYSAYGVLHTITFDMGNGTLVAAQQAEGEKLVQPDTRDINKEGYTFSGWDQSVVTVPSSDIKITALFTPNTYTVTLNTNGGTVSPQTIKVTFDSVYGELPVPQNAGHTFLGWFTAESGGESVDANTKVTTPSNHALYAHWDGGSYTVTFNPNGGTVSPQTIKVMFGSVYGELPVPQNAGHTFLGWFTAESGGESVDANTKVKMPGDHALYAHWNASVYTVTFDYGDGTVKSSKHMYNDIIEYPEDPERGGYIFLGWDVNITNVPDHDVVITALWQRTYSASSSVSSSSSSQKQGHGDNNDKADKTTTVIIAVVIPLFFVIVAALCVTVFLLFKKSSHVKLGDTDEGNSLNAPLIGDAEAKEGEGDDSSSNSGKDGKKGKSTYVRVVTMDDNDLNNSVAAGKSLDSLYKMYPPGFLRPAMIDALLKADLPEKKATYICEACVDSASFAKEDGKLFEGFTEDDAAAIAMYTYDFGASEFECNPYRIINLSLVERNFSLLQKVSGMLYLVMTALRKLPRVTGVSLYRGVRSKVNLDEDHYHEGNTVTWPALSSTSPDMKATKTFLAKGSKSKKAKGTLFIIENGWGYNIQPYSLFPGETEILLEPERQFKVTSVIQAEGLIFISLHMLDTPLALTKVFGTGTVPAATTDAKN